MHHVFWITGLSGSGKTTLATHLVKKLRQQHFPVVLLDGDSLRETLGNTFGYDELSRRQLSLVYAKLCKILAAQGLCVVCSTISLFHEIHAWNRINIPNYIEIFVQASQKTLHIRKQEKFYHHSIASTSKNRVGMDILAEFPQNPHIVIHNENGTDLDYHVNYILSTLATPNTLL